MEKAIFLFSLYDQDGSGRVLLIDAALIGRLYAWQLTPSRMYTDDGAGTLDHDEVMPPCLPCYLALPHPPTQYHDTHLC